MQQSTDGLESLLVKLLECQDVAHHEPNCGGRCQWFHASRNTENAKTPPRDATGF
jgi:hypothetical protein